MPGPRHLYLHLPFCQRKCPYCDFNSVAGHTDLHVPYVDALLAEVRRLEAGPYETIYLGGGTPTVLSAPLLAKLLDGVRRHVRLAEGGEWTCEANPGSADAEHFAVMAEHGVNRLSLGLQSTHDHHLRLLGRVHTAAEGERALAMARAAFPRVSCDLIMGLPGQTVAELATDLVTVGRHDLGHVSAYHLAVEPGTEFHARRGRGELTELSPERSRDLYLALWDGLEALGLSLYETSSFARAGEESRHNLGYWLQHDYAAAGAGAVSTVAGMRLTRERNPAAYIAALLGGRDAVTAIETIGPHERLAEAWMLGLRLARGVSLARLVELGDPPERWRAQADALIAEGLIEESGGHLRLTRAGRPVQDGVTVRLMP
jgi:oxygen-independent coproporphyrinogen-3 oxidase